MRKDDEKRDLALEEEQPSSGSSSSTPGILFSSMTAVRGFPMSPNGTALGVGGPRPVASDEGLALPEADVTPESFARIQKMLGRLPPVEDNADNEPELPHVAQVARSDAPPVRRDTDAPSSGTALSLETRGRHASLERDFADGPVLPAERASATPRRGFERRKWLAVICVACVAAIGLVAIGRVTAPREERVSAAPSLALPTSVSPPVERARPAPEPTISAQSVVTPKPVESSAVVHPSNPSARHVAPPIASSASPMPPAIASTPAPSAAAPVVSPVPSKPGPHNQQIPDFTSKPVDPSE